MAVKTQAQLLAEVASLLADNTTGDISASDVRTCLNDIIDSASYGGSKVYKALLTQSGTSAPVATVLVNTLSGTPVWSYDSSGYYLLTLTGEFLAGKTWTNPPSFIYSWDGNFKLTRESDNVIGLTITGDDVLDNTSIFIEVYP